MTRKKNVPVYSFTDGYDLNSIFDLGECVDNLIFSIEKGYFLTWEAVVRVEQNLPLSEKQEDALKDLLNFSDDESQILYIDELPRPAEPWYETVRKIVLKLRLEPFKTFDEIYHDGWANIADCIEKYAYHLSLPEGLSSLNYLLKLVILPPKDEKILTDSLLHELGMKSSSDKLADAL